MMMISDFPNDHMTTTSSFGGVNPKREPLLENLVYIEILNTM